jgi:hypothetical protein
MKKEKCLCMSCLKSYTQKAAEACGHRCSCGGRIDKGKDKCRRP